MPRAPKPTTPESALSPSEKRWRPIIEDWRRGGGKISPFCRDRGLPLSSFKYWKRELAARDRKRQAQRAATEASRQALQLLPVRILEPATAAGGSLEVVLHGGRTLRIGGDFDPAILRKLVAALEEAR